MNILNFLWSGIYAGWIAKKNQDRKINNARNSFCFCANFIVVPQVSEEKHEKLVKKVMKKLNYKKTANCWKLQTMHFKKKVLGWLGNHLSESELFDSCQILKRFWSSTQQQHKICSGLS